MMEFLKGAMSKGIGKFAILSGLITACGGVPSQSKLDWEQSREGTKRYAHLWESDLEDEFLFGGSVIAVDDFLSGALNFTLPPTSVKLELDSANNLNVVTVDTGEHLMAFGVTEDGTRYEIDFASAGNDLRLRGLIDTVGGQFTVGRQDGYWLSEGQPEVTFIDQDNDTVVVDLLHTVSQVLVAQDPFTGRFYVAERLSDNPGKVKFRLWLQRKKSLPRVGSGLKTVADALSENIGYFASSLAATGQESRAPIQRFAVGDVQDAQEELVFYLKDFPEQFVDGAKEAVLSWNEAFGGADVVKVRIAPETMDVGDPRYHVIKWFDNTDSDLRWAGVAKMIVNPDTGVVMSGGVYIQGSTLIENYRGITSFALNASKHTFESSASIGGVDLSLDEGEMPIVPYFTDVEQNFEEYMQGYYKEVVAHELGHVFGLRHNFKASTVLQDGAAASVMDYAPRFERNKSHGIGSYDKAAIRWGYFGESPAGALAFCTDENIARQWDCNQGDYGDPIRFHARAIVDGTDLLRQAPEEMADKSWLSPMAGVVNNVVKIYQLRNQLTAEQRTEVEQKFPAALQYALAAEPHERLTVDEQEIAQENLDSLQDLIRSALQ